MQVSCRHCGAVFDVSSGRLNRALKISAPLYCGRRCVGLARRKEKTADQKKAEKRSYDANRRREKAAEIKAKKAEYFRRTYDPVDAAKKRKERMPKHVEYCRKPEYRKWKADYDREYLSKKHYGEFWEAAILAREIRTQCLSMQDDIEIRRAAQTLNKHQKRKRDYERTYGNQSEIGALGNPSKP